MQVHEYDVDVEATPEEVWKVFFSHRKGTWTHGDVTIEILHSGDEDGNGLVRHCTFPVPRWLLSGGVGHSYEWLTEVEPPRSWRYTAVGKPLWSIAEGFHELIDLGDGRTRMHFRETYHAFNPLLRWLFERRVHRFISQDNDQTLKASVEAGVQAIRARRAAREAEGR